MPRTLSEQEFNSIRDAVMASLPSGLSEADFHRAVGPAMAQALGTAENSSAPVEGSAIGRFASNAGEMLNPVAIAAGVANAVRHPIDTIGGIAAASLDQGRQAKNALQMGRVSEAIGHGLAMTPLIGPAAAAAGEQIAQGDVAGGLGKAAGLLVPTMVPTAVRAAGRAVQALPEGAAAAAEAGAVSRVADVMAPKVGANKVRFGGMAEAVAPAVAKDLAAEGAPWTREGLHAQIGAKLADAEKALDATSDARLNARSFHTKPLIDALIDKRKELTAEAVEGSRPIQTVVSAGDAPPKHPFLETPPGKVSIGGSMPVPQRSGPAMAAAPIGADVVPGPNAARVAAIDGAIAELKQLGPSTRYEAIRRIRQAYDGPAKTVYSPAVTADFLKNKGAALGAADVTGVLREHLAKWDPETAKANAQYSLYRKANDVLDATAEVERTRPKVGRQIVARLTGASVGGEAAGLSGAAAGYVLGPIVDSAMTSGATTQLHTAALMTKLASAIRRGDMGFVNSLTSQLRRLGTTAAAVVGNATSPSGSQSQTAAPAQ